MPPSVLFHSQNRLGVGCGFDLTLHNDLNRRGRSTSMWSFNDNITENSGQRLPSISLPLIICDSLFDCLLLTTAIGFVYP
jgi:hypothetical protein